MDLTQANNFVRNLIGEPQASALDAVIVSAFNRPVVNQFIDFSPLMAPYFVNEPDPIWGNASMDEIVNARLGSMGYVC